MSLPNKLMCYPQQLRRSWKDFGHLARNLLEPHQPSAPEPSGPHQLSAPEPSGTLSAIWTGVSRTRRNLINYLPGNPPEPHQPSAPEPSGTSSAICTGTLRNLISHLHRNPPEPHQPSAPEPSGTSSAICTGTLRNLISHLHRNPPEPSGTHRNPPEPTGTLRNLLRNLLLQLHRIAPKLFWAKDPIARFAVGEKWIWALPLFEVWTNASSQLECPKKQCSDSQKQHKYGRLCFRYFFASTIFC